MTIDPSEHIGLVYMAAGRIAERFGGSPSEYVGECYLLMHGAAQRFDPAKGVKFSTYAMLAMEHRGQAMDAERRGKRVSGGNICVNQQRRLTDAMRAGLRDREPGPGERFAGEQRRLRAARDMASLLGELSPLQAEAVGLTMRCASPDIAASALGVHRTAMSARLRQGGLSVHTPTLCSAFGGPAGGKHALIRAQKAAARRLLEREAEAQRHEAHGTRGEKA